MEFRVLGPLEVVEGDSSLPLGGARQRTLLALLLTRANEVVSADWLVDTLWDGRPPRTAVNTLQYHVSRLRKALSPHDAIVTQGAGYVIRVGPDELDLLRFEALVEDAQGAPPEPAAQRLREALELWRGPPLADLAHESLTAEIRRLEELRLAALERRIEADLALGRRAQLVPELEALSRAHPYRETFCAQLMLALYGSGRQAEALEVCRDTRRRLVDELGVEPGPTIQRLERAILRQDPELDTPSRPVEGARPERGSITVFTGEIDQLDELLAISEPLAREPPRELILVRLLSSRDRVAAATAELAEIRNRLAERGVSSRVAAFTTGDSGAEAILLATQFDSELLLLAAPEDLLDGRGLPDELLSVLEQAPCDVAFLAGGGDTRETGPIVAPFGGVDHDWSAIELAAWLARSVGASLRLVGTEADDARGRRDASRLLARASMLVQQVVGLVTEPVLVPAGTDGILSAASDARLLVIGLSSRWRAEGIGPARVGVAAAARVPTVFVRRGLRPGGIAPSETLTRFTWTLGSP